MRLTSGESARKSALMCVAASQSALSPEGRGRRWHCRRTLSPSSRTASSACRPSGRSRAPWPAARSGGRRGCGSAPAPSCGSGRRSSGRCGALGAVALDGDRELVHQAVVVALDDHAGIVGDGVEQRDQPGLLLGLGEIAEHVRHHQVLVAGMADAEPDAAIVGADLRIDRAQAVMAAIAAADLHPRLARGEVDLVVEHGDVGGAELVEVSRPSGRCRPRNS